LPRSLMEKNPKKTFPVLTGNGKRNTSATKKKLPIITFNLIIKLKEIALTLKRTF